MKTERIIPITIFVLFLMAYVSATIPSSHTINYQATDGSGNVVTGTFDFDFNFTTSQDCSNVVFSNSTSLTTDSRGVISYVVDDITLTQSQYDDSLFVCIYQDGDLKVSDPITPVPQASFSPGVVPVGGSVDFWGNSSSIPSGWVLLDGSNYSRTTQSECYSILGLTFGNNTADDFKVPDSRSRTIIGTGTNGSLTNYTLGTIGGLQNVTLTGNQSGIQRHNHGVTDSGHTHGITIRDASGFPQSTNSVRDASSFGSILSNSVTLSSTTGITVGFKGETNAVNSHENRQPFITSNKILRCV